MATRKPKQVTLADIDHLSVLHHRAMKAALTHRYEDSEGRPIPVPAAVLSAVGKHLVSSGFRPVPGSPLALEQARLVESLPFRLGADEVEGADFSYQRKED
jgi:hypothetical protein